MKTIKFLMLSAIIAVLATACQDKAALEKARVEAFQLGFDSAYSFFALDTPKDIRGYAHTHTDNLNVSKDSKGNSIVKYGRLALVDASTPSDPNHPHKVKKYIPFFNTKNVPRDTLEMLLLTAPASSLIPHYQWAEIEIPTKIGRPKKIIIAYDLTVK